MEEKQLNEEHQVDAAEVAEIAEDPQDEGFHQVDGEGHVYGRASGDFDEDSEATQVDPDKVQYLQDEAAADRVRRQEAYKDERASVPMQADALSPSTVQVPDRHEHSAHDEESRDKTVDDADFDADEKEQKDNA